MNYKYIYSLFLAFAVVFTACKDEEDVNLTVPSHRVIVTSQMDFENTVNVNGILSFGDVSAGVVSRKWTFPNGVADILDTPNDTVSTLSKVKTQFKVVGEHNVKLHQEFYKDAYDGTVLKGSVLDTTIVVKVLPFVSGNIVANVLDADGNIVRELTVADDIKNEVSAGSTIRYSYQMEGEPQIFNWQFEGGDPAVFEENTEVDVKYKKLGVYDVQFIARRERPFGGDTIYVKDFLSIIPSTEPVLLDKVYQQENGVALEFSREIDVNTLNKDDFNVVIQNGGNTINPTIESAVINPDEANIILLNLASESVYSNDNVTISYIQGELQSTDFVKVESIVDRALVYEKENILIDSDFDYSFENGTNDNWLYLWWGAPWDKYTFNLSNAQAQDGSTSGHITIDADGGMIMGNKNDDNSDFLRFDVEANVNYEIGVWIYVDEASIPALATQPDVRFYWNPGTDWGVVSNPLFTPEFQTGEWVYSATNATFDNAASISFMIRGANAGNPNEFKFYMDNISVSKAPLRP
ncbi:hypothetical protein [Flavicella marina]|uniref:hypothetical protein n=1 Tax=Flavicella marina TaxID=1475951 RepID=UPI0012653DDE|nr:hypothetical protein [Flavicella marina]